MMTGISVKPLFTLAIETSGPPLSVGTTKLGYTRKIITVVGGSFVGDRLSGRIISGGTDAVMVRPDGVLLLDVRLTLKTDQSEFIYMTYSGIRGGPAEIVERFRKGEKVPDGSDYFRVFVKMETASDRIGWLNDILVVGKGRLSGTGPVYDLYEIL